VIHPRVLTLTGSGGTIELANAACARNTFTGTVALTGPAGRHPLADGISALTVVGLTAAPKVERREGRLMVEAEGLHIALADAEVRTDGATLRITLPARRPISRRPAATIRPAM